jgi:hypothetical protein
VSIVVGAVVHDAADDDDDDDDDDDEDDAVAVSISLAIAITIASSAEESLLFPLLNSSDEPSDDVDVDVDLKSFLVVLKDTFNSSNNIYCSSNNIDE